MLLIVTNLQLNAQAISNYPFTYTSGTFTALAGATNPILTGATDEGYYNSIPIGFDFWYMGSRYTSISASSNGWLALGANITDATPINNLTSAGAPRPVIAALWDDLDLQIATNVSYSKTGAIGSQVFTVQYLNVKWQKAASGSSISFQTKLYESTGKIEFIYRAEATAANSPTASIGIAATAIGPGNFLAVSNAGTSASNSFEASITTRPGTGKTYAFTPVATTAPSSLTFPVVGSTSMTLNWVDNASTESSFAIYRSTDGVNYTYVSQVAANATASSQTGLSVGTVYYWKVYAVAQGALGTALSGSQSTVCADAPIITLTSTETCVGGSTATITAVPTGGTGPFTYNINGSSYQSAASFTGLAVGSYIINAKSASTCTTSSSITVVQYGNSADNQNLAGTNSWIGHVYDGISFNNYIGSYNETENFNQSFGGSTNCFSIVSNALSRSIYTETYSIKYRMNSTKKGLYIVDLGSDDGTRLTIDGAMPYSNWGLQSFSLRPKVLISLTGTSSLLYEYYENNGINQAVFQNLSLVLVNTISTNTTQSICEGNIGSSISGDVFGALPTGITLSGTGYQWSYSTTIGGTRTDIVGATAASFTPNTASIPFNIPGTYYVYRNAVLSSVNNVSPNPYIATNESNAATITINAAGLWSGNVSTNWSDAGNWCTGTVPTATTNVVIFSTATRMPIISSSVACNNLTINSGATLTTTVAGTLNIAGTLTNTGTITNTGTTNFNGTTGQQTFSGVSSFYNLTLTNNNGLLLSNAITVDNNLTIASGTLTANNFNIAVKGNWTNNVSTTAFAAGTATVSFNGTTAQIIAGTFASTFNNLIVANTASSVTLNVNASIAGNLSITNGIFDLSTFTANRASAGGVLTLANNATLKIGGTNTYPTNYATNTLVVASTVEYSGTNQAISSQTYGNLTLSSSSAAAVKIFPATALTIVGNLSSNIGAGTSVNFTAAANITVNGNVSIGASTTFDGGNYVHSIGGNWTNNGSFTGSTSTIVFAGAGSTVGGSGTQHFNHLTVTGSSVSFLSGNIDINGNLATTGSGSFVQATSVTTTMTGAGTTISGSSISLNNLTVSGSVSTVASIEIAGNLSVNGSFAASAGTISMSGSSKTMAGAGTINFSSLSITGSIVTGVDFAISFALNVSGSITATAGTATFTGISSLSGTANLFNATINGTFLQLSANSNLGIANLMTIIAGALNVNSSPNTVNFNSSGAQNINAITYDNLMLSNGSNKSAIGSITINNSITITSGTTFIGGAFTHYIYKNWTNNGSFAAGAGSIEFLGNQTATITGATTFNILNINNSNATTGVVLNSSISVGTINMVLGELLTGTETLSITNTRTGNASILGNIKRSHAFTTGIDYAFESANNTINFSAVSLVNSITVSVVKESVADFTFASAVNRRYTVDIPSGTYTATLRLHYEDAELNGNDESTMGLWNYNGTLWIPVSKTANSTSDNYLELSGLTNIGNRWTFGTTPNAALWTGAVSSNWNDAGNWVGVLGSTSIPPSVNDVAVIGFAAFGNQPTIGTPVTVKNLVFGTAQAVTLSMASGGSLTSGDILTIWDSSAIHTINVNNQTITVNGDLTLSDGTSGHQTNINIGSGTLSVTDMLTQSGSSSIAFSGAGNLNIGGDYNYVNGTFTSSTGTVTYNGANNQVVGAVAYNNLAFNKSAAEAFINNPTTIAGNLTINAGDIDNNSITTILGNVSIAPGGILENFNILHIGGNWTNNGTYTGSGINTIFDGAGTQTISATTFDNLEFNKPVGSLAVLTGDVTLKGNLVGTSGTLDIKSFFFNRDVAGGSATIGDSATFLIAADNAPNRFANYYLALHSTVVFNGTGTQHLLLPGVVYGNISFRNSGTKILYTPITVNGNLTIESSAIFDAGANTITLNGNWINSGTFVPSTSTVVCNGSGKTVTGNTSFNKANITGSYTLLNDVSFNGLLTITSAGAFYAGPSITVTMNSDLINSGILYTLGTTIFTGNVQQTLSLINAVQTVAITVNFNGSVSPILNSTSAPQYGFLNINNTGGVNPSVGWTIAYELTVGSGALFNAGASSHIIAGYLTNNGTITSNGTLTFVPSSATTINLGSNFTSTGNVNFAGAGAMTIAGSPISFNNVSVSNANAAGVAPSSDWAITNKLTVSNSSIFNAGNHTYFIGGNILNNGTINSGTSTFTMNGNSAQDIYSASAFNNLTINKATGITTLSSNTTVNTILNFVAGKIQTGIYNLIQPSSGTVIGAAQNTGWVNGKLQKNIAAGNSTKAFEIGDSASYTPVAIVFSSVSAAGDITASTTIGDHMNIEGSKINSIATVNRTWTLKNEGTAFSNYDATFHFVTTDMDSAATAASFIVAKYGATSWAYPSIGLLTDTSLVAKSLSSFGDFQIGNPKTNIPLPNLGTTANFALFTTAGAVGNTGTSFVNGNIGTHLGAVTGFGTSTVNGSVYIADAVTGQCATDLLALYTGLNAIPATHSNHAPAFGGGETLYKGVYAIGGAGSVGAVLNLDAQGDPDAVFIFKIAGAFTTGASTTVNLLNEATSCHVFWIAEGAIAMAASTNMKGTLIANNGAISMAAGGVLDGRMFSTSGAVAIDGANTSKPSCYASAVWSGISNNNWDSSSNWQSKLVPVLGDDIIIPFGTPYSPLISANSFQASSLFIEPEAILDISSGLSLNVSTQLTNYGTTQGTGMIQLNGTSAQIIIGTGTVSNLELKNSNGATIEASNTQSITGTLTLTAGTLTTNNELVLKSTASGTAMVAPITSGGVTGNVTVERYISALNNRAYRLVGSSVNTSTSINANWQEGQANPNTSTNMPSAKAAYGTHITGAGGSSNGFDATVTNQASLFVYNPANPSWDAVTNTQGTLNANTGYLLFIRGNRDNLNVLQSSTPSSNTTLRTTGTLQQGTILFNGLSSNTNFSIVTNPYAAPILWDNTTGIYATGSNDTNFENYITIWDPNVGTRGGFVTVTTSNITAGGTTNLTNEIQSGQAFFVQAKAGITAPSLSIQETNKSTNNNLNVFRSGTQIETLKTFLFFNNTTGRHTADGVTSMFNNNYTTAVDGNDAIQIDNWDEDIAISRNGKSLSIEQRPLIDNNDTIQLAIARLKVQAYEWEFQPSYFNAPGLQAFLQDNFTNTNTAINLNSTSTIPFTVTNNAASAAANRFRIVFRLQGALPVTFTSVKANQKNQGIQVDWAVQNEVNVDYYEVEKSNDGIQFIKVAVELSTNNTGSKNYTWFDANPVNGINHYRIKSMDKSGKQSYSQVVKVSIGKAPTSINVYPNPVQGNSINLQLNNLPRGNYTIVLTNNIGQQLFRKPINHNGGSAIQAIELNNKLSIGTYQLEIVGDEMKLQLRLIKQ